MKVLTLKRAHEPPLRISIIVWQNTVFFLQWKDFSQSKSVGDNFARIRSLSSAKAQSKKESNL